MWLLAIVMFCCQTGSYGLTFWVPTIVKGLSGYTEFEVGLFSAVPYIAAALGMVLVGRSSDRTGERFLHVAIPSSVRRARFHRGGLIMRPRPRCWRFPLPRSATTARAVRSGRCRENSWSAAPPRAPSRSSIPWARSAASRSEAVGWLKDETGSFLSPLFLLSAILVVGAALTCCTTRAQQFRD